MRSLSERVAKPFWMSTAASRASFTLGKAARKPSPVVLKVAPRMAIDRRADDLLERRPQIVVGGGLVLGHQAAVADDVAGQDRGQLALHGIALNQVNLGTRWGSTLLPANHIQVFNGRQAFRIAHDDRT